MINAPLIIAPFVDFLTGKIIEAGAAMDPAKLTARAQELISINLALLDINSGNTAGISALQNALNTTALSPGEAMAIQALFATVGNQVALVNSVAGGTLLGEATTAIATEILQAANTVANAYVAKYGKPA